MKDDDIQQIFFVECDEALEAAESGLDACKAGTHDAETINAIFRGVHSIKGGAGAFGHAAMQAYTHCFENLLGEVREGAVALTPDLVDLLLTALDVLRDHVEAARGQGAVPDDAAVMVRLEAARAPVEEKAAEASPQPASPAAPAPMLDFDLDALLDDLGGPPASAEAPPPDGPATWLVHIRPHAGAMDNGGEPVLWLRELARLGGECVRCDAGGVPGIDGLSVDDGYLGWSFRMPGHVSRDEVAEIFDFAGESCSLAYGDEAAIPPARLAAALSPPVAAPPSPVSEPPAPFSDKPDNGLRDLRGADRRGEERGTPDRRAPTTSNSQSVRIDLAKLDRLIDAVGELVIAQSMLAQRLENESFAHIEELALLETLVRDIQEHAMAFRAQPISAVFGRVPRLLRELASNTGKHVKLQVSGETTELDKTVIERLSEPMTHLIRNAVDHGIEPPAERIAAGKEPEGTLSLSAEQKAGRIVIQIRDDGRGINRDKVLAKAIASGIIAPDAELTDDEINQLIFAPGFSTAAEITSVSGRGVGMDVVKSNVKDLGGRITIETTPGEGTTFTLALPLTLAISDGMIVQTGDQALVIPLAHVIESLRPAAGEVKGLGTRRQMLNVRGRFVPIVSLAAQTGARAGVTDPSQGVLVLVETESHGQAALLVDAITDQRQFVIKSLDANFRSVDSVAGATILGNGKVALIVDVDYLVAAASGAAPMAAAA